MPDEVIRRHLADSKARQRSLASRDRVFASPIGTGVRRLVTVAFLVFSALVMSSVSAAARSQMDLRSPEPASGAGDHTGIDVPPASAKITVPDTPDAVAVGVGAVWAALQDDTVVRINPKTKKITATIKVPGLEDAVAVDRGAVWVVNGDAVSRIDSKTNKVAATIPLEGGASNIAVGEGSVWVSNHDTNTVTRLNAKKSSVDARIQVGKGPSGVAVGKGAVWVANIGDSTVSRINSKTNQVQATVQVSNDVSQVAVGGGAVWVTSGSVTAVQRGQTPPPATVSRIDPKTNSVERTIEIGGTAGDVVVAGGDVWVASPSGITISFSTNEPAPPAPRTPGPINIVSRIDPKKNAVVGTRSFGSVESLGSGEGALWVTDRRAKVIARLTLK